MKKHSSEELPQGKRREGEYRVEGVLFAGLALLSILLMGQRLGPALHPEDGRWIITTGFEQEALNTVWLLANDQGGVYPDPASIPYRSTFFNSGFYGIYSLWTGGLAQLLGWESGWVAPLGRILTLLLTGLAMVALWALLRGKEKDGAALGSAAALAFSPLIGYWAGSVRPDMASVALELAAAVWACRLFKSVDANRADPVAMVLVGLFALAAWSMKQTAVVTITAVCLVLLVRGQWKPLLALVVGTWLVYATFLILGGETYRYWLIWAHLEFPSSWAESLRVAGIAAIQSPLIPICFLIILLAGLGRMRLHSMSSTVHLFGWIWFGLSALISILAARKFGASSNYFILFSLVTFWWAWRLSSGLAGFRLMWFGGVVLQGAMVLAVSLGLWGRELGVSRQLEAHRQLHRFLSSNAEGPVFVDYGPGNLPWILPVAPHFVLAHNYPFSGPRKADYEAGGVEGLMNQGFFQLIVQPRTQSDQGPPHPSYTRRLHRDRFFDYFSREPEK